MANSISVVMAEPLRERSLRAAYINALWWAVMFGAGESSISLFAAHIHAPDWVFGALAGVPALLGPLMQIWSANVLDRCQNQRRMVLYSVFVHASCFVPLAFLAFWTPSQVMYAVFFGVLIAYFAAGNFIAPPWNAWIAVLVPSERRPSYFASLIRGTAAVSLIAKLAAGGALYWAAQHDKLESGTRWGCLVFSIAFALSAVSRFISWRHITRMHEPPFMRQDDAAFTLVQFIQRARESNFVHFVFFVSLMSFAVWISGPFFLPYISYKLHFASWQWIVIDSSAVLASVLAMPFWARFSARHGNKLTLAYTAYGIFLIPLPWLFSADFYFLIASNAFSGIIWGGFNLASFNYIFEAVTPPKRARCTAYFSTFVGIFSFAGSAAGTWLSHILPEAGWSMMSESNFAYLLVITAVIRLLAALFLLPTFKELGEVQPLAMPKWFYYITEVRFPVGLRFGAITENSEQDSGVEAEAAEEAQVPAAASQIRKKEANAVPDPAPVSKEYAPRKDSL